VHRVLFRIPMPFGLEPLQVAAYGAMVALGALAAIYIASVRAKRAGVNPNLILDLALVVVISGMIGARLFFFVFDDWSDFTSGGVGKALKQFINFPSGGLSFYGALAFAIPAGIIFLHTRMKHIWAVADIAMPSIALGIAFARIGCYLNGCCFGKPCAGSFPLAQRFPLGSIPADHYLSHGATEWPVPIYPTQLISSLNAFALFLVLSVLFRRRRFDGQVFCLFGIWYGISRFLIEFLRGDNDLTIFGAFTTWQLAGLVLVAGCAAVWVVFQRRGRLTPMPA
jgi:phosphatidylglycerol:prolipoprotein diacylglycerol transferase